MLIQCKECGESVSDKASICPHCGFPLGTKDSCDGDIHETYLRKLKMVIMRFGQYLKAGLVFRDGICPTFGMYVNSDGSIMYTKNDSASNDTWNKYLFAEYKRLTN